MKTENIFFKSDVSQRIANAKGKYSTQFMCGEISNNNSIIKKTVEDSVRMGGYEVSDRKPANSRVNMQQPISQHSENWFG